MLVVDPMKRVTIPEIRQHAWFQAHLPRYLAVPPPDTMQQAKKVFCLFVVLLFGAFSCMFFPHYYFMILQYFHFVINQVFGDWLGDMEMVFFLIFLMFLIFPMIGHCCYFEKASCIGEVSLAL